METLRNMEATLLARQENGIVRLTADGICRVDPQHGLREICHVLEESGTLKTTVVVVCPNRGKMSPCRLRIAHHHTPHEGVWWPGAGNAKMCGEGVL